MALISAICPECHESIKVDDSKPFGFCFSCGAKIALAVSASTVKTGPSMEETINNYVQLATNAKAAGNNAQCEQYCNKILEIDSSSSAAWALKASASGWQSTLANIRLDEMILYYGNANKYSSPGEQRAKIKSMAKDDFESVVKGLFDLAIERFSKWPDNEESQRIVTMTMLFLKSAMNLIQLMGPYDFDELSFDLCVRINDAVVATEENLISEFVRCNSNHPTQYDLTRFIEKMGACSFVLTAAATLGERDYNNYSVVIDNQIKNHNVCMQARGYSYERHVNYYTDTSYYSWDPIYSLNDEACRNRKNLISQCEEKKRENEQKRNENDKEAKDQCREIYWQEHHAKRTELENQKKTLTKDLSELKAKREKIKNDPDVVQLENEVKAVQKRRESLGMFKLKEKKELDALILQKQENVRAMINEKDAPYSNLIQEKEKKLSAVNRELNAEHPECADRATKKVYKGTKKARLLTTYITIGGR